MPSDAMRPCDADRQCNLLEPGTEKTVSVVERLQLIVLRTSARAVLPKKDDSPFPLVLRVPRRS